MLWKLPPGVKVLEALGCIGDNRIVMKDKNRAVVFSSERKRAYLVVFYPEKNKVYSDDNASKFRHYIGYPIIAFFMKNKIIDYDKKLADNLKGINWHKLNLDFKRDYQKVEAYIEELCEKKGINREFVEEEIKRTLKRLEELKLEY
ncbi:MAG: hypothetical protein ACP5OZ_02130 [Candidatus Woesearchaeota archaeon]